ncbi:MAG: hypothetical protein BWX86_01870 [Verrucomicrobia bacterium ADurb.Bin122]|nr:MAG: hypothetical protein BWX86_01870 [Verrucomicrobia bacterium ADurb.Bin122]
MWWKKPLDGDAAHLISRHPLKNTRTERPGAENGRVDDALVKDFARRIIGERLRHMVHEIHQNLLLLCQSETLLLDASNLPTHPPHQTQGGDQRKQANCGD